MIIRNARTAQGVREWPVYIVRLWPLASTDAIRELRAFLKIALRRFRLQCLGVTRQRGR